MALHNLDRQTATGHERCGASHQRHTKIRTWSDSISTRRSTLAGRPTAHQVQAVSAGVQVFTRLCTAVSCRAMCTGRRRLGAPQSALCHSRTTKFPSVQHDKLWRRAFSYAGPHAWNSLLEHLRQTTPINLFKRSLKTFLFGQISRLAR